MIRRAETEGRESGVEILQHQEAAARMAVQTRKRRVPECRAAQSVRDQCGPACLASFGLNLM